MPDIYVAPRGKKTSAEKTTKPAPAKSPSSGGEKTSPDLMAKEPELEQIKKERHSRVFSSFLPHPRWTFETQEVEEKIVLVLRRHWITNVRWWLAGAVFLIMPLFLLGLKLAFIPLSYRLAFFWIWYLLLAGFLLERFLDWFFNVFIITDERIVDFDFYGLIYKEISDAKIENIQDVTYKVSGFLPNLLDYGEVVIQTSAQIPQFEFTDVPHPARVARVLRELITQEEIEKIEGRVR